MLRLEQSCIAQDAVDDALAIERRRSLEHRARQRQRVLEASTRAEVQEAAARHAMSLTPSWVPLRLRQCAPSRTSALSGLAATAAGIAAADAALRSAKGELELRAAALAGAEGDVSECIDEASLDADVEKATALARESELALSQAQQSLAQLRAEAEGAQRKQAFVNWLATVRKGKAELADAIDGEWGAQCLRQVISGCELQCFHDIMETVNFHLAASAGILFEDNLVEITLGCQRELKSKPNQTREEVCVSITREGLDFKASSLSGGELARVNACLTFALSAVRTTGNLVVLDEVTASLDPDSTARLVAAAKNAFPDRLLLFVCHQVTTGLFDRVVQF
jgi:hypothetical protein